MNIKEGMNIKTTPEPKRSVMDDWEKARTGEMTFKAFADKWLPYAPLQKDLDKT